ncbi:MAG: phospho-N-acetylmuramoyl-pentapeptide-transferase [Lentisphaerae bacterium GWF2_52_8]|nr:MAG: phospho-N-acetylmuramoyl-pentapeptide-transferase [Lentisphaerae bacterium GWF2_52_8]
MFHLLLGLQDYFGPLRLFEYVTFRAGGALITAMFLCFLFGPFTVRKLKEFRANAPSRLKGLVDDKFIDAAKNKTPSMGGVLIVISISIATLLWGMLSNPLLIVFLSSLIAFAAVGFFDDYVKVAKFQRDGISGKLKILFQFLIAISSIYFLDSLPETSHLIRQILLPFVKDPVVVGMGVLLAYGFGSLVVVGSSNAVNLTDGKDGLAVGCTIFCTLTYAAFAYLCGHKVFATYLSIPYIPGAGEVVVFAAAIAGACIGFLWHNCHPASMFMGDTGSLALGGTIGLLAVLVKQEITLIIVGGVFVMEALSVMLQVASFKLFKKRIFLCTPIHHHFEQKGWTETQIVVRFWILSGIFALVGLATLKLR